MTRSAFRSGLRASVLALAAAASAQQSGSFRQDEHVLNQGGHPEDGSVLASSSFTVTLDALGEGVVAAALASASYRMDGGLPAAYPPPGEVAGVRFEDPVTLAWDPERSRGTYGVYRGLLSALPGGYGACVASGIATESATDADLPAPGQGFFYLVTVENRLGEEGTKGFTSSGAERPNAAPCP